MSSEATAVDVIISLVRVADNVELMVIAIPFNGVFFLPSLLLHFYKIEYIQRWMKMVKPLTSSGFH